MRAFWLLLALIPGAPAILRGHVWGGAALLLLGFGGWDLTILGTYLLEGHWADPARGVGLTLGVGTTLLSVVWTFRMTSRRRRERLAAQTVRALEDAHTAYLRGEFDAARGAVRDGLRIDARDVDLIFLDWQLACERGDTRGARKMSRRLRRLDLDEKWLWEVDRMEVIGEHG